MKNMNAEGLINTIGGTSITSSLVNAFTNVIKVLLDAGRNIGSGIRRITSDSLCEIK